VVDDSAVVRKVLTDALASEPDLEVVGTAPDPFVARDKILALNPDVLTLDIEMPRMDGLTFLRKLMQFRPMPVIVISSLAQSSCQKALEALQSGAVEVLGKPGGPYSVGELKATLALKIRAAAAARIRTAAHPPTPPKPAPATGRPRRYTRLIAIGASTGGTEAILALLRGMPAECPPIAIVQHIPPVFSEAFAKRLNEVCAMEVREAKEGDEFRRGLALIAPGNLHMTVESAPAAFRVRLNDGLKVCFQRPAVDVLFHSVAQVVGKHSTGVLLTGMGSDGAAGLLKMRQAGAHTVAQNEASCVVFGMPREAIRIGAAVEVRSLHDISCAILESAPVPA